MPSMFNIVHDLTLTKVQLLTDREFLNFLSRVDGFSLQAYQQALDARDNPNVQATRHLGYFFGFGPSKSRVTDVSRCVQTADLGIS